MGLDDFILTIESDDEEVVEKASKKKSTKKATVTVVDDELGALNPEFTFEAAGDAYDEALEAQDSLNGLVKGSKREPVSVDDIIERRKRAVKRDRDESEEQSDGEEVEDDSEEYEGESDDLGGDEEDEEELESDDPLGSSDEEAGEEHDEGTENVDDYSSGSSSDESDVETQAQRERKAAYFAAEDENSKSVHSNFTTMNLSRPIQKALTALGFSAPTPIQAATIPVALLGKDVVGNAVTGSGKTAAFMVPILERLMYRERGATKAAVRCVVLVPTRELAVQCTDVARKIGQFTDVRVSLIVGGLSVKAQEAELRTRPDILVATPGRLVDHLRNAPGFALDTLDVLVLDEADRMLADGFADELHEIVSACPRSRQTLLFSATMTDDVDALVRMSLDKPVRLFVDPRRTTARKLIQEFVRVRVPSGEKSGDDTRVRSSLLAALCAHTCKRGVLIFVRSKRFAHQLRIAFGLLGMRTAELHGDLTQEQRLRALQQFRDGKADFLLCTDLASRGLDIKGVQTVVNFDMPGQLAQYLHRVGRTARAGRSGRAITLVGEADRKMLKAVIKHSTDADKIRHRTIPPDEVAYWSKCLNEIKDEIGEVLKEEKEEKAIRQAEMEVKKGENMMEHESEIFSRPARTWFQSENEKRNAQEISKRQYEVSAGLQQETQKSKDKGKGKEPDKPKRDKYAGLSRRAKRRKMAMEEDDVGETAATRAAVRSAKKASRPTKIGMPEAKRPVVPSKLKKAKTKEKKRAREKAKARVTGSKAGGKSTFDRDLGEKRRSAAGSGATSREGARANRTDKIGGMGKKGSKGKPGVKGKPKIKGGR